MPSRHRTLFSRFLLAILLACLPAPEAAAWEAPVGGVADGQPIAVVDKEAQRFFWLKPGSVREYVCTTGKGKGDKQLRGDLKTPEGIYFITGKRRGLDFEEYGGEAYMLDYPNPVDRQRGKTGSGIWVHSRGRSITPFESRGCIVLNLGDIRKIGPELKPGTPVLIGKKARNGPKSEPGSGEVERLTREWLGANAQGRHNGREAIRTLEGPGYWVAWVADSSKGGSPLRLYWEQHEGAWRLAGVAGQK